MALVDASRVKETTTTTGTGTLSLAGAATGFQTFVSGIGNGNTCYYYLIDANGSGWEFGIGTVASGSPNTLARTTVLKSTNSDSAISLSSGTHTVFNGPSPEVFSRLTGGNTFTGTQIFSDADVSRAALKDCALPIYDKGTVSTTQTVTFNYEQGHVQKLTVSGTPTITFAFSNWPASGNFGEMRVILVNGGLGTISISATFVLQNDTTTTTLSTYITDRVATGGASAFPSSGDAELLFTTVDGGTTVKMRWL